MKKYLISSGIYSFCLAAMNLLAVSCSTGDGYADSVMQESGFASYYNEADDYTPSLGGDQFGEFTDNPFVSTALQPQSTFSVDADGASYAIMRNWLSRGFKVDPSSVRIEEFLNYFTFDYVAPTDGNNVAINAEVGECPWNPQHRLLRLGLKGKELKKNEMPRANFVFLVDVSGSMDSSDKLDLLKSGLKELVNQLNPDDRISLITYSGEVKKLLESTRRNGLFEYPKIDGVRLHCDASIAFYLYEHQKSKKFKIERQDDGSLIITLKPAFQHDVIRWVLGESGKIEVLAPLELREKVAAAGKKIWERNQGSPADA